MRFDFKSGRVTEGTQKIQEIFERQASISIFRCGEYLADSFLERVGLLQEQVQRSLLVSSYIVHISYTI